jgi:hypothetical protein
MAVEQEPRTRPAGESKSSTAEYVYGVTWKASAIAAVSGGIGDAAVGSCTFRDLAALTSAVGDGPVRARKRDLTRHSDVLAAAFRNGAVVPLRFGTVFASGEAVLSELLEARYGELTALLRELEGLAELRVSAFYREEAVLGEIVASDARVARLREVTRSRSEASSRGHRLELGELVASALAARADADAAAIVRRLTALTRDVVVEERLVDVEVVRASFLVDLAELGRFDAEMDELARSQADRIDFKYVGPLPPHSFVSLPEAA